MKRIDDPTAVGRARELTPAELDIAGGPLDPSATPHAWPDLLGRWNALREALPGLVDTALRRVVDDELAIHPAQIEATVRGLLARLDPAAEDPLRLRVHPDDVAHLSGFANAALHIEADATIKRGGCVLSSPRARFDARLETRLARVLTALREH